MYQLCEHQLLGVPNDPQTAFGRISSLLAKGKSQDRQATQPRHVFLAIRGDEARTSGSVFQESLILQNSPLFGERAAS